MFPDWCGLSQHGPQFLFGQVDRIRVIGVTDEFHDFIQHGSVLKVRHQERQTVDQLADHAVEVVVLGLFEQHSQGFEPFVEHFVL